MELKLWQVDAFAEKPLCPVISSAAIIELMMASSVAKTDAANSRR